MSKVRRANCHVCDAENMPWNYSPTGYFVGVDGPGSWDCTWSANRVLFCDASCAARDVDLVIGCNRNAGTGTWFQVSGDDDANCHATTTEAPTTTAFVEDDNGFCGEIPQWENFEGGSWICDSDEQNENTRCNWICDDGMQIKRVKILYQTTVKNQIHSTFLVHDFPKKCYEFGLFCKNSVTVRKSSIKFV